MRLIRALAASIAMAAAPVSAATIEIDVSYTLGPVAGSFGNGQTLSGVGIVLPDPFVLGIGDTLVFDVLFTERLQVFDLGDPTEEVFSFGLDGPNSFNGTWASSIEALDPLGNVWSDPISVNWQGGGAGFGWGGVGVNITDSQGSFGGIRWITQIIGGNEGAPLTLTSFTGVQMHADGIHILPAPVSEPGTTVSLLAIGWLALSSLRRRTMSTDARSDRSH